MRRLTWASLVTTLLVGDAAAQISAEVLAPGRHHFICDGGYRYRSLAEMGRPWLKIGPETLILDVGAHDVTVLASAGLPGSPYSVTAITAAAIEFEGVEARDCCADKGKWWGTFSRVHGTLTLSGPQAADKDSSHYTLTCRPTHRLF